MENYGQIIQVTNNWQGEEWRRFSTQKNYQDTVLVIFDPKQDLAAVREVNLRTNSITIDHREYSKKYPKTADDCIELRFVHDRKAPIGNEEYIVDKRKLSDRIVILNEEGTNFLYWFESDSELFEKTIILIEASDWLNKKEKSERIWCLNPYDWLMPRPDRELTAEQSIQ
ncbi:hypothetical protein [Nitritalea halalkaliphila]|nr:hypothetical protein [Nitritalea halalkaliphila]